MATIWIRPEVCILGADQKDCTSGDEIASKPYAHAQYGKLVLEVYLALRSKSSYLSIKYYDTNYAIVLRNRISKQNIQQNS